MVEAYTRRERHLTLATALLGWAFDGMDFLIVVFLARDIAGEFGLTDIAFGAAVLLPMTLSTAVGGIVFGALADRYGRKRVLTASILVYSIATGAVFFAPNLLALVALRMVAGLGVGGEWAIGFALLNEVWGPSSKHRGALGGLTHGFFGVGFVLAAIIAATVAPAWGWRAAFGVAAFPALLVFVIRLGVPESKLWLAYRAAKERGELPPHLATVAARTEMRQVLAPEFRRVTLAATLLAVAGLFAYYLITSWLPTFLRERGMDPGTVALTIAVMALFGIPATTLGGALSDRIGRRPAFLGFTLFGIVGMALFVFATQAAPALVIPSLLVYSFSLGYFGIYGVWYGEIFPTRIRASGPAFAYNLGRGAVAFAGVIVPAVGRTYGIAGGMSVAILAFLAMAGLVWMLPETRGRALTAVDEPPTAYDAGLAPREVVIQELPG